MGALACPVGLSKAEHLLAAKRVNRKQKTKQNKIYLTAGKQITLQQ
jgi:hypothetical protein